MSDTHITFRPLRLYKYQLTEPFVCDTDFKLLNDVVSSGSFISLTAAGLLTIKAGYACDGPSGPTIDTSNFMRAAFVHDALYQLIREGLLASQFRRPADKLLRAMCLEDGMSRVRAWWVYWGVRLGGASSAVAQPTPLPRTTP